MFEFIVIVESSADARTATKLAERVILEKVDWLELEYLSGIFCWSGLEEGTGCSCWKDIKDIVERAKESGIRLPKVIGHHGDSPLKADGAAARKVINLVRYLQKHRKIRAVLLIRDLDNQPERKAGLEQAAAGKSNGKSEDAPKLTIVIGTAERNREAWVLNGFMPQNPEEEQILAEIKAQLNFDPCLESHRLRSQSFAESDRMRNPKVVLEKLTGGEMGRERQCWEDTGLEILRERGIHTGLTDYICEVEEKLIPIMTE